MNFSKMISRQVKHSFFQMIPIQIAQEILIHVNKSPIIKITSISTDIYKSDERNKGGDNNFIKQAGFSLG